MNKLVRAVTLAALLAVGGCSQDPATIPAAQPARSHSSAPPADIIPK